MKYQSDYVLTAILESNEKTRIDTKTPLSWNLSLEQLPRLTHGLNKASTNPIAHHSLRAWPIKCLGLQSEVPIKEKSNTMPVLLSVGQDSVTGASIVTSGVSLHHITHVNDESILNHWDGNPTIWGRIIHLEARCAGFLEKDGYAAEVGVISD